ncbi:MAG: NnrS family protein [Pseudomonadota bacterium]
MNQEPFATKHYLHYPKGDFPPYLAYGFRAIFLLLAPYIVISILLWGFVFGGYINPFINDMLSWHIYEFLYGVGIAGVMAFLFTGLPELFPGTVPIVGKKLALIVGLWVLGRVSFWFIDFLGVYVVAIINLALFAWIISYAVKPVIFDPLQKHASIGYTLLVLFFIEVWFFGAIAGFWSFILLDILKVALGGFMTLTILVLRRVNMEAMNEIITDEEIDDSFIAKPPRYNLAVFTIVIFTLVEFFFPQNQILGWLGLAAASAILAILSDFVLENESIFFKPYTLYMMTILILMALGYGMMGYDYLNSQIYGLNHFRHFLTTGAFGLSFYMVMIIISQVHTGRHLKSNLLITLSVFLIVVATFIRVLIPFFTEYAMIMYLSSSIIWALPFIIYSFQFFLYLIKPRVDGIAG